MAPTDSLAPRRARRRFFVVLGLLWLSQLILAAIVPRQGDDWLAFAWFQREGWSAGAALRWLARERIVGDLVALGISVSRPLHMLLSPLAVIALLLGLLAHVRRRLPRPDAPGEALALALVSALIWIGAPHAALTLSHRTTLALFVYGLAALVWFTAAYRLAGPTPRGGAARAAGMALLGLVAGTSNHHVVAIALVALPLWLRARRRRGEAIPGWMWSGLCGLVAGALLLALDQPYPQFVTFATLSFEGNTLRMFRTLAESGRVISLSMLAFLLMLARSRLRSRPLPLPGDADLSLLIWLLGLSILAALLGLLGPRWGEPSMFAPALFIVVGAAIALDAFAAADRLAARVLAAVALFTHGLALARVVPPMLQAGRELHAREAILARTPPGGVALIPPLEHTPREPWFYGEDLGSSRLRAQVADAYDLETIELTRPFDRLQGSADHELVMVWTLAGREQPVREPLLTHDLSVARDRFSREARRLHRRGPLVRGELLVENLDFAERRGRKLVAARWQDGEPTWPIARELGVDRQLRYRFLVRWRSMPGGLAESYAVGMNEALPTEERGARLWFRTDEVGHYTIVRCGAAECVVLDCTWTSI